MKADSHGHMVLTMLVVALLVGSSCTHDSSTTRQLRYSEYVDVLFDYAGESAIDCGIGPHRDNVEQNACVENNFEARNPLVAQYVTNGTLITSIVISESGDLLFADYRDSLDVEADRVAGVDIAQCMDPSLRPDAGSIPRSFLICSSQMAI